MPSRTADAGRSTSILMNGPGSLLAAWMLPGATRTPWRRATLTRMALSATGNRAEVLERSTDSCVQSEAAVVGDPVQMGEQLEGQEL